MSKTSADASATHSLPASWIPPRHTRPDLIQPDRRKAAIYARYSTSMQHETSVERQCEIGNAYIDATDRVLVGEYLDRARSGAYTFGRDALDRLMADAARGKFGIVVVENVDRLARDLGILSTVYKTLLSLGIEMHQPGRGKLSLTDIAVQGLMGDEGRRILAERTQFSRNSMARQGRVPTGPCYGYVGVPGRPGEMTIDEERAPVVRRIFSMRASGLSPRLVAVALNADGIRSRTGRDWSDGLVRSILGNPRYVGVLVYSRHATVRNPITGKSTYRLRPRADWIVTQVPDLRIVDHDVWEQVQRVHLDAKAEPGRPPPSRSNGYLLSGILGCSACGGGLMIVKDRDGALRCRCRAHGLKGTCAQKRMVRLVDVERTVLDLVSKELEDPAFIEAYLDAYNTERERLGAEQETRRSELERRVASLDAKLRASFEESLTRGLSNDRITTWRLRIEGDLVQAEADLARIPRRTRPVGLDRTRIATLRDLIGSLARSCPFKPTGEAGMTVLAAFRDLVEKVVVAPAGPKDFRVTVAIRTSTLVDRGDGRAPSSAFGVRSLEGYHRSRDHGYGESEERKVADARAAAGTHALDEREWTLVQEALLNRGQRRLAKRRIDLDAMVFRWMTGAVWAHLPRSYGEYRKLRDSFNKLQRVGIWQDVVSVLVAHDPVRWANLMRPWTLTGYRDLCAPVVTKD